VRGAGRRGAGLLAARRVGRRARARGRADAAVERGGGGTGGASRASGTSRRADCRLPAGRTVGGAAEHDHAAAGRELTREQVDELADSVAELRTSQGTVVIGFLPGKAPNTVKNFVDLAQQHFYDGTKIHRVIPGMFIQGGDPTGTGDGGPGYFIPAEFNDEPHVRGTVSMARLRHPDSAGSQFFICLAPLPYLDGGYTAFGRVLSGDEVLDRIEKLGRATPQGTPTETITLEQVLIRPRSPAERPTASHP
jgi:peptidyl-prolyl cis-trans isomerase B (cyclophilin B)